MGLTEDMIVDYLVKTPSLKQISNHEVKDSSGDKTGQTILTITVGKQWIDELLQREIGPREDNLTQKEVQALNNLRQALDGLPLSMNMQSLMTVVSGLDSLQKNLLESINVYLASISQFEEHRLLLKAVVLVLKIIEYDLSKNPGPITVGIGFFSLQVLSDEQRIDNHATVQQLLTAIVEQYDVHYERGPPIVHH